MGKKRTTSDLVSTAAGDAAYDDVLAGVSGLLESARHAAARSVHSIMTATYWEIGRRIVEHEQGGKNRAAYGARLVERLSADLTRRFGRGFGVVNLTQMRKFYQSWPTPEIVQTLSEELSHGDHATFLPRFPLSWSQYVRLLSVSKPEGRAFYETEALRGGWTGYATSREFSAAGEKRANGDQRLKA